MCSGLTGDVARSCNAVKDLFDTGNTWVEIVSDLFPSDSCSTFFDSWESIFFLVNLTDAQLEEFAAETLLPQELLVQLKTDANLCYNPPMCSGFSGDLETSCNVVKAKLDAGENWQSILSTQFPGDNCNTLLNSWENVFFFRALSEE